MSFVVFQVDGDLNHARRKADPLSSASSLKYMMAFISYLASGILSYRPFTSAQREPLWQPNSCTALPVAMS